MLSDRLGMMVRAKLTRIGAVLTRLMSK